MVAEEEAGRPGQRHLAWRDVSVGKGQQGEVRGRSRQVVSGQEASEVKLRENVERMARENRVDHVRARVDVRSAVEGVDQRLQEEFTRVAEDATVEGRRHVTNLRFRLESMEVTMTDTLEQSLAEHDKKRGRVLVVLQRAVEEHSRYHRVDTEALDRKLTDMVGAFVAEHNEKRQETHTTLQQSYAELFALFHSEVAQVVDGNERTQRELAEANHNELRKVRRRSRTCPSK